MTNYLIQDKMTNRGWVIENTAQNTIMAEKQHSDNVVGVFEWDAHYATYKAYNVENPSEPLVFFMKPNPEDRPDIEAERLFLKADSELVHTAMIANNNLFNKTLQSLTC